VAASTIDHGLVGELAPGTTYQVLLFMTASSGTKQVASTAEFTLTPVLPQ
jgi:hypothetical protein